MEKEMGNTVKAVCDGCNFSKMITIGGSRSSYMTHCYWPMYCEKCRDISDVNIRKTPFSCDNCESENLKKYDARNLVKGGTKEITRAWDDVLTDGDYFCPKCEKFELRFIAFSGIFFD